MKETIRTTSNYIFLQTYVNAPIRPALGPCARQTLPLFPLNSRWHRRSSGSERIVPGGAAPAPQRLQVGRDDLRHPRVWNDRNGAAARVYSAR